MHSSGLCIAVDVNAKVSVVDGFFFLFFVNYRHWNKSGADAFFYSLSVREGSWSEALSLQIVEALYHPYFHIDKAKCSNL